MNSSIHTRSDLICILGTIFLVITLFSSSSVALEIMIGEKAVVTRDQITLGEIARFSPADDMRIPELKKIKISTSPSPGSVFRINERLLVNRIDTFVSDHDDIRVIMPENLHVRRSAQYISHEELETIFRDHVISRCAYPADGIVIDRISAPDSIPLPEGRLTWRIQDKENEDFVGNVSMTIDFSVDDRVIRKVPLSGTVLVKQAFLKTLRKIRKGDIISENDLVLVNETNTHFRTDALTNMERIIGKKAIRNINVDKVITERMFEEPPLVKKGDGVLIKAENDEVRITTLGKAMEDGREGDQVKVINVSSGKEIFAVVTGPTVVEVNF